MPTANESIQMRNGNNGKGNGMGKRRRRYKITIYSQIAQIFSEKGKLLQAPREIDIERTE